MWSAVWGVDVCPPSVFSLEEIISSSKCDDVCSDDFVNVQVCRTAVGFPKVTETDLLFLPLEPHHQQSDAVKC